MPNPLPTDIWGDAVTVALGASGTVTFQYAGNTAPADDLPEITDATAVDGRSILYGILEKAAEWYEDQGTKPEKMRISRAGTLQDVGGVTYINRTYSVTFRAVAGDLLLQPEAGS